MKDPSSSSPSGSGGSESAEQGDLWSWAASETPAMQNRPPPEEERFVDIEQDGPPDWSEVLRAFQDALDLAYRTIGASNPDSWELLTTTVPQEDAYLHRLWQLTWRVQALASQLAPRGAICFSELRPFPYNRSLCGLCGGPLSPSQHYTCVLCAIAQHLVLANISWAACLRFLRTPEGMDGSNDQAWLCLLSSSPG